MQAIGAGGRRARYCKICAKAAIALATALCMAVLAACGGNATSSSAQGSAPGSSAGQPAAGVQVASGAASRSDAPGTTVSEEIDSRYVGEWIGYDIYTMQDVRETYVLHDNGDWATLVVNADGSASLEGRISGTALSFSNLHLERAPKGYLAYDEAGGLFGDIGYNRSGTTDWLILSIPDEEVGMVCYTFFINDR